MKKNVLLLLGDVLAEALPVSVVLMNESLNQTVQMEDAETDVAALPRTQVKMDTTDWHEKFADKFTDTVVSTADSYTSPNLSIQLSYHSYDSGRFWRTRARLSPMCATGSRR